MIAQAKLRAQQQHAQLLQSAKQQEELERKRRMGSPLSLRDPGLSSASNIKTVASVNADQRRVKVTTHLTVQTNLTPRPLVENMNYA